MKKLLMCVLILGTIRLTAQEQKEVQAIPELQEWYSIKGGFSNSIVSYLPGFDSSGGGINAIVIGQGDTAPTWYNRFPYDTTNHFTWVERSGNYIVYGDFNGDGIRDYWGAYDRLYKGIKNGSFPNPKPDTNYYAEGLGYRFVADYNGDGYDDMLQQWSGAPCTNCHLFRIVWGGKDLKKLKQSTVGNFTDMKSAKMLGVFLNENKEWRVVSYEANELQPGNEVIFLYSLTITPSDIAPKLELTKLDEIRKPVIEGRSFEPCCNFMYWNKSNGSNCLMLTKGEKQGETTSTIFGYKIIKDKFEYITDKASGGAFWSYLSGSIDRDNEADFIAPSAIVVNGVTKEGCELYSGNPLDNPKPVAYFLHKYCGFSSVSYIGDVNKDSIGDIAYGSSDGCFSIYLGLDWRTVGIDSERENHSFSIQQNEPNPILKDRKTLLPITLKKSGKYILQLYDMQGNIVKTLFDEFLPEGENKLPLDISGLPIGMYIVKMSDGKQTRERAIMIGE